MTTFAVLAALMLVAGVAAVARPLLRDGRAMLTLATAGFITVVSVLVYLQVSNYRFDAPAPAAQLPANHPPVDGPQAAARATAASLADRVEQVPDDRQAWLELGRARLILSEFDAAIAALRRAGALESRPNAERMIMLGEALAFRDGQKIPEEAAGLFTDAVDLAPRNPKALWYASLAYAQVGDNLAAADALERLVATDPPADIVGALNERIAALRGEAPAPPPTAAPAEPSLEVAVSLGESLTAAVSPQARLFVAVRDADNGGPPLAALQRDPTELPLEIEITDADAMIRGRGISSAETLEIVARVSMSGDPLGGAGDYVGRLRVPAGSAGPHRLVIDSIQQ